MPKPHAHVPAGHPSLPRSPVSRVPRPSTPPSPACRPFECEAGTTPSDSTPHSPSPRARAAFSARTQSRRRRGAGARPRPVGCGCHCRAISVLSCRLGTPSRTLQHTARQTDRLAKTADHPPTPRGLSERYSLAATLFLFSLPCPCSPLLGRGLNGPVHATASQRSDDEEKGPRKGPLRSLLAAEGGGGKCRRHRNICVHAHRHPSVSRGAPPTLALAANASSPLRRARKEGRGGVLGVWGVLDS